jgi:signal transduction histidine kinase
MPLRISERNMLSVIEDIVVDLSRKDQNRLHINGAAVHGHWDGEALTRAIENLVSNAIKYGEPDSPITINLVAREGRVIIYVINQGKPIPIEDQEVLFQVYRRANAARTSGKKGWGIGLALVRGVAEAHGGSVSIDSANGRTTFLIDIPQDARPFQN